MRRIAQGKPNPPCGVSQKFLIVDCETTGGNPAQNALIELGVLSFRIEESSTGEGLNMRLDQTFEGLQDPGGADINPFAMKANGLKISQLRGKALDLDAALRVADGAIGVIAHNARFDHGFVLPYLPMLADLPWYCSLRQIPWKRLGMEKASLSYLCERMNLPKPTHRALADVEATFALLQARLCNGMTPMQMLLEGEGLNIEKS